MNGAEKSTPVSSQTLTLPVRQMAVSHQKSKPANRPLITTFLLPLYLVSLALPVYFFIGPLRLSPNRMLLLLSLIPLMINWLTDAKIKKNIADFLLIFYVLWAGIAISVIHGVAYAVEPFGMLVIETFGSFFLARTLVRDVESFEILCRWLFGIIVILAPFAVFESITGTPILLQLFSKVLPTYWDVFMEPRWGFDRAQVTFEHPILWGVFCGSAIGLTYYAGAGVMSSVKRGFRTFLVFFASIWALSSGPLTGISGQILLIGYEIVSRRIVSRWKVAGWGIASLWIIVDLFSNRTPPEVFITYFAFSAHNAYNRIRIWDFGSASVMKFPLFGLGFDFTKWERPEWMSQSVDMFWLLPSMQFGLPAGLALIGAFLYIVIRICRAPISNSQIRACRFGLLTSLLGVFLSGWTVHYWNATYSLTCFLFGAGVWLFASDQKIVNAVGDSSTVNIDNVPKKGIRGSIFRSEKHRRSGAIIR